MSESTRDFWVVKSSNPDFNDRQARYAIIKNRFSPINNILSIEKLADDIRLVYTEGDDSVAIYFIMCKESFYISATETHIYIASDRFDIQYRFTYDDDIDDISMIVSAFNILFHEENDKYLSC